VEGGTMIAVNVDGQYEAAPCKGRYRAASGQRFSGTRSSIENGSANATCIPFVNVCSQVKE
jgi:hypothetical protein